MAGFSNLPGVIRKWHNYFSRKPLNFNDEIIKMNRRKILIIGVLFILLNWLNGFTQQNPLTDSLKYYWEQKKYSKAIKFQKELLDTQPTNASFAYNLACLYSLNHDTESALKWLKKASDLGFSNYIWMQKDSDLVYIQKSPEFDKVINRIKAKLTQQNAEKSIQLKEKKWMDIELKNPGQVYPHVNLSLSFDTEAFYINAEVHDTHFLDGNRSWRYGDGFFINFVMPDESDLVDSERFYAYGFSREEGKPVAVLVNHNGDYYLSSKPALVPDIEIDSSQNLAKYRINIPWDYLSPFHPLVDERAGINIIYISQNDDGSRTFLKWVKDPYFDTESTDLRRFAPLYFDQSDKSPLQMSGMLDSRWIESDKITFQLIFYFPEAIHKTLTGSILDSIDNAVVRFQKNIVFAQGKNSLKESVEMNGIGEGRYRLKINLSDSIKWKDSFFEFDRRTFNRLVKEIRKLKIRANNPEFLSSVFGLEYRLKTFQESLADLKPRETPFPLANQLKELKQLTRNCKENQTIYNSAGYLLSAFRSSVDSTLQPFSVYLPQNFDKTQTYHLLVALHGSGVDEINTVRKLGKWYDGEQFIVLGTRGRDLSSWYVGKTEKDVVDVVREVKKIFRIDKTFLYGFSMGGYGAWRISFLYSKLFNGVIVHSGIPYHPRENITEYDMRNFIGNSKHIPYLVVHGTSDRSLNVKPTDKFVEKLKTSSYSVHYHRVEGGGHGNFDASEIIRKWLVNQLNEQN